MKKIQYYITTTDKRSDKALNTRIAIKEMCALFGAEPEELKTTQPNKDESGVFCLPNGKWGIIIALTNNTNAGKIAMIKKIKQDSGECLIYVPEKLRTKPAIKRFVKLITNAYDGVEILDGEWLLNDAEMALPHGSYWKGYVEISKKSNAINISLPNIHTFYNFEEIGLLAIFIRKNYTKEINIIGHITKQFLKDETLLEWKTYSINNKITRGNQKVEIPETKKYPEMVTNQFGEIELEDNVIGYQKEIANISRRISNEHSSLSISYSNFLRKKGIKTKREFLDIDIIAFHEEYNEIFEVKTSSSEIYKATGQLFFYKFRAKEHWGKPVKMSIVVPKTVVINEEWQKRLIDLNINLIYFDKNDKNNV